MKAPVVRLIFNYQPTTQNQIMSLPFVGDISRFFQTLKTLICVNLKYQTWEIYGKCLQSLKSVRFYKDYLPVNSRKILWGYRVFSVVSFKLDLFQRFTDTSHKISSLMLQHKTADLKSLLFFLLDAITKSLHKIGSNAGFLWPLFSRIKTESWIQFFYGNISVRENPYLGISNSVSNNTCANIFYCQIFFFKDSQITLLWLKP